MAKKALCVGINDYPFEESDLRGCVNDAQAWATLLKDQYDFPNTDIKILNDKRANKANMIEGLKGLLSGAKEGDVLVYTFSGHGTYVADFPNYDQAQCPYDCDTNLILDDELRALFLNLPQGF